MCLTCFLIALQVLREFQDSGARTLLQEQKLACEVRKQFSLIAQVQ